MTYSTGSPPLERRVRGDERLDSFEEVLGTLEQSITMRLGGARRELDPDLSASPPTFLLSKH
jgi:hypothetical protein